MGFDLIGRNIDESHTGDSKFVIPVHIVINGISYDSLDDYLESRGIPKNSIKFSCSNRNWHTIWEYVQYSDEFVDDKYKFIGDEEDFEGGNSNSGHFINEEKAISIFHCCNKGIEFGYFNQYIKERCSWADDSDKKNILEFIERFMDFCKTSGGFLIL
tara:strand:- start:367 stop:840 length:474 start_codon:yes stop_codon:yes gene_type:complete